MHGMSGDPVNRGRVNTGLIVNPNFGEHSHAWYIERDTVNRGPVNRGMTVYIIGDTSRKYNEDPPSKLN